VYLEGASAMFKISTERTVSLSTTKAETYAGVTCVQDMLYIKMYWSCWEGAVYLAKNWELAVGQDTLMSIIVPKRAEGSRCTGDQVNSLCCQ
jgi:hypothetical protein